MPAQHGDAPAQNLVAHGKDAAKNAKVKAIAMTRSGQEEFRVDGRSVEPNHTGRLVQRFHHSTETSMIGMLTKPTRISTAPTLAAQTDRPWRG